MSMFFHQASAGMDTTMQREIEERIRRARHQEMVWEARGRLTKRFSLGGLLPARLVRAVRLAPRAPRTTADRPAPRATEPRADRSAVNGERRLSGTA